MANSWADFEESISGTALLLPRGWYHMKVAAGRVPFKAGATEPNRAIVLDLVVQSGPFQGQYIDNIYISIPEPGNRAQGGWYLKKMHGFGNLTPVYEAMPDNDLAQALEILIAALQDKEILADIGPGEKGFFEDQNNIFESKEVPPGLQTASNNGEVEQTEAQAAATTATPTPQESTSTNPAEAPAEEPVAIDPNPDW